MMGAVVGLCGMGLALLLSACATAKPVIPTEQFVTWSQDGARAKRLCVLPFDDQTEVEGVAAQVRRSFAGHLSVKWFADAELHEIDTYLNAVQGDWVTQSPQQLGQALACDALVYGVVSKAQRLYLGIYSHVTLEGTIQLVDATTGQTLIHGSHTTRLHSGGLPLSPIAIAASAIINLQNMTSAQMVRAIDDLGRNLAALVPDLRPSGPTSPVVPSSSRVIAPAPPPEEPPETSAQTSQQTLEEPLGTTVQASQQSYRLRVAAFGSYGEAQKAVRLLRKKGYHPAIAEVTEADRSWHRVVLGPFPSVQAAEQVGIEIQQALSFVPVVTPAPHP